jgi:dTDP-4-amino-4,6-dideoxygalactose transaminase
VVVIFEGRIGARGCGKGQTMEVKSRIGFNKPFIVGKELYYIAQAVMVEARLSGNGVFTRRCHELIEEKLGCAKALLTHSCTAALEMAAMLCNIQEGDEIIMPSFTFVSTANAFVLRGGVPVFVDIRPDTLNIDEGLIESAITPRTKAIVPVHYAGVACVMEKIMKIADQNDLWVVEDTAQALHSTHRGRFLGTFGHLGCLSFHETKNIISGEGGALLINDERFIERARIIWEKGTNRYQFFEGKTDKYTWVDLGSSFLPSELIAAFLFAQLEQTDSIISARRRIFNQYHKLLRPLEEDGLIHLPFVQSGSSCNGHLFYIITKSFKERARLINFLAQNDVLAVFHYVPLHSSPAGKKYGRIHGNMDVTDDLSGRLLRLPLYYEMTDADVERVTEKVKEFYGKR